MWFFQNRFKQNASHKKQAQQHGVHWLERNQQTANRDWTEHEHSQNKPKQNPELNQTWMQKLKIDKNPNPTFEEQELKSCFQRTKTLNSGNMKHSQPK